MESDTVPSGLRNACSECNTANEEKLIQFTGCVEH